MVKRVLFAVGLVLMLLSIVGFVNMSTPYPRQGQPFSVAGQALQPPPTFTPTPTRTAPWAYDQLKRRRLGQVKPGQDTALRQTLCDHFDIEELRTLCTDLDVDYDSLRGEGKEARARELIAYLDRRGELGKLVDAIRRERGNVI